jgi:MFS family permease
MKPWQTTFLLVSLLGLPCALLVGMLIEPQRHSHKPGAAITSPSLREAWSELWLNRAFYVPFYLGMALAIIPIYAFPAWVPATAMRQFGVSVSRVGIDYGTVSLISGSLGVLAGPSLARLGARMGFGRDINVRLTAWCALAVLACCVAFFFRTSYGMTIGIAAVVGFFYAIPTPMAGSALQLATPPHVRGLASGIYIVVVTLMGLGVAPLTVAFLTDKLFADEQRVGDALAIVCAVSALASAITLSTALPAYRRLMSNLDKQ